MAEVTNKGVPYVVSTDAVADYPTTSAALAQWLEARPGVAVVTTSQRDSLSGGELWAGRTVFNTTVAKLQVWGGSSWSNAGEVDHGALSGLGDDDHPQYAKKAGDSFSGPVLLPDGSAAAPGAAFSAQPSLGLRRKASGVMALVSGGADVLDLAAAGLSPSTDLGADLGSSGQRVKDVYLGGWAYNPGLRGYTERIVTTATSGTVTLNLADSNVFDLTPAAAVTIAFSNAPAAGRVAPFTLIVRNSTYALTWPAGTKFTGGSPPALDGETWISGVLDSANATIGLAWKGVA